MFCDQCPTSLDADEQVTGFEKMAAFLIIH